MSTHLERTVALLAEVNPAVAAAVAAVGSNWAGDALPGLLGWLDKGDRLDLCRAVVLAAPDAVAKYAQEPEEMAEEIFACGGWQRSDRDVDRVQAGVLAWIAASDEAAVRRAVD